MNGLDGVIALVRTWSEEKRTTISFTPLGMIQAIISLASKFWWTGNSITEKNILCHLTLILFLCFLSPEDREILLLFDFKLFYGNSSPFPLCVPFMKVGNQLHYIFNIAIV